jgi:hypothetical protein
VNSFEGEIRKAPPSGRYPIVDIPWSTPSFTRSTRCATYRKSSINFFGSGGRTSERGADSAQPHARAIADEQGHMIVLMTHNTDFGDAFEREGDNQEYFNRFAADGYAFGINVLVYAMSH